MSGSTQNKTNPTLGKKTTSVVSKAGNTTAKVDTSTQKNSELKANSAVKTEPKKAPIKTEPKQTVAKATAKRTPVTTAPKKTNTSTAKPVANKAAPKKVVAKKAEPQKHIADQVKTLSSQRVWPD